VLVPIDISTFAVDASTGAPALVLKEICGDRTITVPMGHSEAGEIAMKSMGIASEQPMAVDLAGMILQSIDATLSRVIVEPKTGGGCAARLFIGLPDGLRVIQARVSDAVALALRFHAPILAREEVLEAKDSDVDSAEKLRRDIARTDTVEFGRYYLE
jgi:bifunctional DNase/RNase